MDIALEMFVEQSLRFVLCVLCMEWLGKAQEQLRPPWIRQCEDCGEAFRDFSVWVTLALWASFSAREAHIYIVLHGDTSPCSAVRHLGEKTWKRLSLANLDFEILGFLCLQKPFWGQSREIWKLNLRESQALYCYNCHWQFNTMNKILLLLVCFIFLDHLLQGYIRITRLSEKELDLESWCVCSYLLGIICRHRYLDKSDASVEAGELLVLTGN